MIEKAYSKKPNLILEIVRQFNVEIDTAYYNLLIVLDTIEKASQTNEDPNIIIHRYWFSVYLTLMEGVWTPLGKIILVLLETPKESSLIKYKNMDLGRISDRIKSKKRWHSFFWGWDKNLRNHIAHNTFLFSDMVFEDDQIIFQSKHDGVNQLPKKAFVDQVNNLFDCCSAFLFSLLKAFSICDYDKILTNNLGFFIKRTILKKKLDDMDITVSSMSYTKAEDEPPQINITVNYNRRLDAGFLMYGLYVFFTVSRYFEHNKYFITFDRKGKQAYWIQACYNDVTALSEGKKNLESFIHEGKIQLFFVNKKKLLRKPQKMTWWYPSKYKILFHIASMHYRYEIQKRKGYRLFDKQKRQVLNRLQYEISIYLTRPMDNEEILRVIKKEIHNQRKAFRNLLVALFDVLSLPFSFAFTKFKRFIFGWSKEPYPKAYPSIVFIKVWAKEKRGWDVVHGVKQPLLLCLAEWNQDPDLKRIEGVKNTDIRFKDTIIRFMN